MLSPCHAMLNYNSRTLFLVLRTITKSATIALSRLVEDLKNNILVKFWIWRKNDFIKTADKFLISFAPAIYVKGKFSTMLYLENKINTRALILYFDCFLCIDFENANNNNNK